MQKNRLYSLLTLLLVAALFLGACPAPGVPGAAPAAAPAEGQAAPAPAADLIPVTYTYAGRGVPADLQEVQDAMNQIRVNRISCG